MAAVGITFSATPYICVFPFVSGTGFGTKWANPAVLANLPLVTLSFNSDTVIAVGNSLSPFFHAWAFSDSTGFGTKYAAPSTIANNPSYVSIGENAVSFANGGSQFRAYGWSSSGFGTLFTPLGVPTSGTALASLALDTKIVLGYQGASTILGAIAFDSTTGFDALGNLYAPSPSAPGSIFSVQISNASTLAVGTLSTPQIFAVPYDQTAIGNPFGTNYAAPATRPLVGTNLGIGWRSDSSAIMSSGGTSPYIAAHAFTTASGFGTKFSNPASLPTAASVGGHADGTDCAVVSSTRIVSAYPLGTTSFGTKYSVPVGIPATGTAASIRFRRFVNSYSLTADTGAYTVSGIATGLLCGRKIVASQASYTLAGSAATLTKTGGTSYSITASVGSFTLSGIATGLLGGRKIAASQASYAIAGSAAGLLRGRKIIASQASYTLTGQAAGLLAGRKLAASQTSFILTGLSAGTLAGRKIAGNSIAYIWSGFPADFTKTSARTVFAATGHFAETGNDINLLADRIIQSSSASLIVTGISANTLAGRKLSGAAQSYLISASSVGLISGRRISIVAGSYQLTGLPVGLGLARAIGASAGLYSLVGRSASLISGRRLVSDVRSYLLTGRSINLTKSFTISIGSGSFALVGHSVAIYTSRVLATNSVAFEISFQDAALLSGKLLSAGTSSFVLEVYPVELTVGNSAIVLDTGIFSAIYYAANLTGPLPKIIDSITLGVSVIEPIELGERVISSVVPISGTGHCLISTAIKSRGS